MVQPPLGSKKKKKEKPKYEWERETLNVNILQGHLSYIAGLEIWLLMTQCSGHTRKEVESAWM